MSLANYISTETGKVAPVAAPDMPELKTYDIPITSPEEEKQEVDDQQLGQADIWNLIQSRKPDTCEVLPPYVHPLVRRSSISLSQKSLEICTESLGSETGSDDFLSSYTDSDTDTESEHGNSIEFEESELLAAKDIPAMKIGPVYVTNQEHPYHCTSATVSRKSPPRSFPPPLRSISSRNGGPYLRMRPHRCGNGRLVMEAVSMPTQNYLHARRLDGRLQLSFADQSAIEAPKEPETESETESEESETEEIEMEESEEEEEVEVVDRGSMVEVKVSTQPNQPAGRSMTASKKVHRSSLVINKFVGSSPDDAMTAAADTVQAILPPSRRAVAMLTTAAAAVVAASALSASSQYEESHEEEEDGQLLFVSTTAVSRRRSKEELLHQMRRCSQLRRPLFIWEPRCIATL
jgi:Fantastic Four meristem regulator